MNPEDLSREDLIRVVKRDRWVKEQQSARISALMHENLELLGLYNESQEDLAAARALIPTPDLDPVQSNGDVTTTPEVPVDVTS